LLAVAEGGMLGRRGRDGVDAHARSGKGEARRSRGRDVAGIAVTERGVVVYTFHDAEHIGGKGDARGGSR
jgi:hypothetical protein